MRGRRRALAAAAAALALVAACAPHVARVPPLAGGTRAERFRAGLLAREQRAAMVEGEATLWPRGLAGCDSCPPRRLPAVQADLALAWPDAFRLRVGSLFGTALDLGLAGDSTMAYAPAQRWGVALDAVRDSFGLAAPGRLAVRLACAAWRPPGPAWDAGTREGDLLVLRWQESADSLALAVDPAGTPAWARLWRDERRGVIVRYERWEPVDGVAWPVWLRVRDLGGTFELDCRLARVTFAARPDRARLAVRIPADADRLGLDRLRGLLERVGGGQ